MLALMANKEDIAQLKKVAGEHIVSREDKSLQRSILKDAAQNGGRWTRGDTWHKGERDQL